MSVDVSLASEFPNDNPALHCGVIWVCLEPTGPAVAQLFAAPAHEAEAQILIEELTPFGDEAVEVVGIVPVFDSIPPPTTPTPESAPPPASDDPFMTLVCTLADV